jgi:hypothetical protein
MLIYLLLKTMSFLGRAQAAKTESRYPKTWQTLDEYKIVIVCDLKNYNKRPKRQLFE